MLRLPPARPQIQQSTYGIPMQCHVGYKLQSVQELIFLRHIHSSDCFSAPASGFRTSTTGALNAVGTYGGYWSASPSAAGGSDAGFIRFDSSYVNPLTAIYRTYAFTVRCVQHLRAAFSKESSIFAPTKQLWPGVAGCLSWFPSVRLQIQQSTFDPKHVGRRLFISVCCRVGNLKEIDF